MLLVFPIRFNWPSIFRGLTSSAAFALPNSAPRYIFQFSVVAHAVTEAHSHWHHIKDTSLPLYAKISTRPKNLIVCKPGTDIRVHVSGIVIRIRIRDTAIRIRVVVRPIDHTGLLGNPPFFMFFECPRVEAGGLASAHASRSRDFLNRLVRLNARCPFDCSSEGKPGTDTRTHVSGIVIRTRIRDTATRIRGAVRPIDHTGR